MNLDDILGRTMVTDQCWLWLGPRTGKGYGQVRTNVMAHRAAYEIANGEIPAGAVIDHTCHDPYVCVGGIGCVHRLCVNPEHLQATTHADNLSRQSPTATTECVNGHLYDADNTGIDSRGRRYCRACRQERARRGAITRPVRHARSVAIRQWARENGIPVGERGRISSPIEQAWIDAGSPGWPTPKPQAA